MKDTQTKVFTPEITRKSLRKMSVRCLNCLLTSLILLSFYACSGRITNPSTPDGKTPVPKRPAPKFSNVKLPPWVDTPPFDNYYYYGVGNADTLEEASEKARAALIRTIEVDIKTEIININVSRGSGANEEIDPTFIERSRSYATQKLPEVHIVKQHRESTGYYTLARLEREIVQKLLEEAAQHSLREVKDRIKHGDDAHEQGNLIHALQEYEPALKIARALPRSYKKTPKDHPGGAFWDSIIERKIRPIYDEVNIEAISGNEQTGEYGSSLSEPLVVQVRYRDKPLSRFPLKAVYTRGAGRLKNQTGGTGTSIRIYTDSEGKGSCWVDTVGALARENYIQITADTESIELPASKAVSFRYASAFPAPHINSAPIVTLNGRTDEQEFTDGQRVAYEIRVPDKCYLHLFSLRADNTFGYHQSLPVLRDYKGEGWRIFFTGTEWIHQMDEVPLFNERGLGLETLFVVTTMAAWEPTEHTLTTRALTRQLDQGVGEDQWRVGWVSSHVIPVEK